MIKVLECLRSKLRNRLMVCAFLLLVVAMFMPTVPYWLAKWFECTNIEEFIGKIELFPFISICLFALIVLIFSIVFAVKISINKYRTIKLLDSTILKLQLRISVTYDELRRDLNELL